VTPVLPYADDLDATLDEIWGMLARGVADRKSPARTPTLASIGRAGGPALRTVVLRGCDPRNRCLLMYTDARTEKAAELAADPRAALHVYDSRWQRQIRLGGDVRLHRADDVAVRAWARMPAPARANYRMMPSPGTPVAAPSEAAPNAADEQAENNFSVLAMSVAKIDWVYLAADRHRRAAFEWDGERWRGTWLAP
jgi:pyridoxamine 5'-phosphate oxidase